jgi:hypothetical protein
VFPVPFFGNKGIHEDWFRKAFSMLVLRLVLLINDLLTTFPSKQKIIYDESHFEFISCDQAIA